MLGLGLGLSGRQVSGGGTPAYTPMDQVTDATVLIDIDATIEDSYPGTGTNFANLTAAGSTYDFTISGATFTGTAGDGAAYFLMDGSNDLFTLASGTNPDWLRDLHKADASSNGWLIVITYYVTTDNYGILTTQTGGTASGLRLVNNVNEKMQVIKRGSSNSGAISTATFTQNAYNVTGFHTNNGTSKFWVNTTTAESLSHVGNGTTNATRALTIGEGFGTDDMRADTRVVALCGGSGDLTNTQFLAIMNEYASRHEEGRYSFL